MEREDTADAVEILRRRAEELRPLYEEYLRVGRALSALCPPPGGAVAAPGDVSALVMSVIEPGEVVDQALVRSRLTSPDTHRTAADVVGVRQVTPGWPGAWPDVLRWVSDEQKEEENVSDEIPRVMEVASPAERAAAGLDPNLSRWRGFSDEELQNLLTSQGEMTTNENLSAMMRSRARVLEGEIAAEQARREAARPSYRGPGRYRAVITGTVHEVLGVLSDQVIVRSSSDDCAELTAVTRRSFEGRHGAPGERIYEYVGPLEDGGITVAAVDYALRDALARAESVVDAVAIIGSHLQGD